MLDAGLEAVGAATGLDAGVGLVAEQAASSRTAVTGGMARMPHRMALRGRPSWPPAQHRPATPHTPASPPVRHPDLRRQAQTRSPERAKSVIGHTQGQR